MTRVQLGAFLVCSIALGACATSQTAGPPAAPGTRADARKNAARFANLEADDAQKPVFPLKGSTGHRTDDDKVDSYVEASVNADGSWNAFMHTTPTGHFVGGCARYSVVLYDGNGTWLYARELANFCTGTRDGVGGPPDREDRPSGAPGEFPADALQRTRKWSVVADKGQGHIPSWEDVAEAAKVVAQVVQLVAAAN